MPAAMEVPCAARPRCRSAGIWRSGAATLRRLRGCALLLAGIACGVARAGVVVDDPVVYAGQFPQATNGLTPASLTLGGVRRDVLAYRPPGAPSPAPLLVFFSGTGATLEANTADEIGRDWLRAFADREGVVLAFPIPLVQVHGDWDNHSSGTPYWETATAEGNDAPASSDADHNPDLLLTRAIIKEAIQRYGADASRVYVSGFSNGAMFAYFAAMILKDRVAAFAETGGGLILSNTTAGEPAPCVPSASAGTIGSLRSCAASGWVPGACQSAGAVPRPIAVPATGRVPPGFLRAHDDDGSVPYAHTCNLAAALSSRTEVSASIAHQVGGHYVSLDFLESSWAFLRNHRLPPQTGWWWNPLESGRGFSLEVNGNSLFMAAFLYAPGGRAVWYASGGALDADGGYHGQLQEYAGGQTLTGPYQPAAVAGSPSSVALACSSSTACTLSWAGGSVPIQRFNFDNAAQPANAPETGWWWNEAESGRGYFIEMQGGTLFATGYMYDPAGNALWYLASGAATPGAFQNAWSQYANGQTLTGSYTAAAVVNSNVGAVSLQFSDTTHATLTLPDGRQVPLARFRF